MQRLSNIRIPVIVACLSAAGVVVGVIIGCLDADIIWIAAVVPVAAAIIIVCCLKRRKAVLFIAVPVLFFIGTALSSYILTASYGERELYDNAVYTVTGTVINKGVTDYGEYIVIDGVTADGKKLTARARVYLGETYGEFCDIGYKVSFEAKLGQYELLSGGMLTYSATKNLKYYCTVNGGMRSQYSFSLFGSVRRTIKQTVYANLSYDSAAIVCAMLLGDTDDVDDGSLQAFRYGGIAHIFAVSGLHIGIIYGMLSFLFKRMRLNKFIAAALCVTAIIFYAGVCGFTLSSVRAVIMCTVSTLARLTHNKRDGLNSLAAAVTAILIVQPFSLFTVGFQLSVCSVGGIILLAGNTERCLGKLRLPKSACRAVGVSLGAEVGTLPVLINNFGYISAAGLLMNVLILPLMSALFALIFFCVIISAVIVPIAAYVVPVAALPLETVLSFLVAAGFENSVISGNLSSVTVILYYIALLFATDKFNLRPHIRILGLSCALSATALSIILL